MLTFLKPISKLVIWKVFRIFGHSLTDWQGLNNDHFTALVQVPVIKFLLFAWDFQTLPLTEHFGFKKKFAVQELKKIRIVFLFFLKI